VRRYQSVVSILRVRGRLSKESRSCPRVIHLSQNWESTRGVDLECNLVGSTAKLLKTTLKPASRVDTGLLLTPLLMSGTKEKNRC
jgi:hypothetical protein